MAQNQDRFKQGETAAIVGIVGNILLAILKWWAGTVGNSRALIADAVHSASDVAGSFAVYIGLRAAKQPPDKDHPYGHGKAESIAAIIVAVLLFLVGFEIGKSSIESFFHPLQPPKMVAIYVVIFSIIVKEVMFQYKYRLGKRIHSDALIVNAYEHRSDVFSSIAALIGIGAAILGGALDIEWLVYADPVAGLFVAVFILKMAWTLGSDSIHTTLDHVLHEEDTLEFKKIVKNVPGVLKLDQLHAREHGHYVIVDIKVSVDPHITVEEGHRVGKNVKKALVELDQIQNVFVHINPYNEEDEEI
ncbi:cation transporter [Bacillus coahuilensis p1.1.43]|uniref:Cation transporter n=1 Tax=Bacillus coahuilensis p1.1.43 TaxID=1150625 RepID=A0A147K709_9BACI|nr:cation diffusion facilitator family transporter [Bacillus coahuilensis]KUP05834.1 cation transporter [Bacillus coahuilensis p1.1.43]